MKEMNKPAIVRQVEDLTSLADSINSAIAAGESLGRKSLEHYRRAGEALIRAKELCGHGKWLGWLRENVKCSQQQAWKYMQVAENWAKLQFNCNLEEALRLLSQDGSDEESIEGGDLAEEGDSAEEQEELIPPEVIEGVGPRQAKVIVAEAKRIADDYDRVARDGPPEQKKRLREEGRERAKKAAEEVAGKVREKAAKGKKVGAEEIRGRMEKARTKPVDKPLPTVQQFCDALERSLRDRLSSTDQEWIKLNELIRCREQVDQEVLSGVIMALEGLAERCRRIADSLRACQEKLEVEDAGSDGQ